MTSIRPQVVTGWIVPGVVESKYQFSYVTNEHYGGPAAKDVFMAPPLVQPKTLGDERHSQLITAIKGLSVKQQVEQNVAPAEAIVGGRDWR